MERKDDFQVRRKRLAGLSDEELYNRFWELVEKIVDPLLDLAFTHTSPAVERSVLLRMGFSSLEAKAIVEKVLDYGLLGKGAGNIVYRYAKEVNLPYREAGLKLADGEGWDVVEKLFAGGVR